LGELCRAALLDPENDLFISSVSCIELARLVAIGRIEISKDLMKWIDDSLIYLQATLLPLDAKSAVGSYQLPDFDHRDPVDRLLLATARQQQASLLTCDRVLLAYGQVETMDARG
jgi:PIN domain nuclease of toxin-antitoxin system